VTSRRPTNRPETGRIRHRDRSAGTRSTAPEVANGTDPTDTTDEVDERDGIATVAETGTGADDVRARVAAPGPVEAGEGFAIATVGLTKRYGSADALSALDLRIPSGERVALVGHNGSGKTTLIRLLTGMLDATEGSAIVGGHAAGSLDARMQISYLADQPVFYDDLSVTEHLEYVARLHGRDDWTDAAADLLDRFGLTHRADDLPNTFSRGLRQKAAICLAFVRPFEILVVDEPFVGLDASGRTELLALFDDAHHLGRTLVVATHELTTVTASERLIALRDGELVYDGPSDVDIDALVDAAPVHRPDVDA
jgi:ABC-type multidrug transport system ATPase subunit